MQPQLLLIRAPTAFTIDAGTLHRAVSAYMAGTLLLLGPLAIFKRQARDSPTLYTHAEPFPNPNSALDPSFQDKPRLLAEGRFNNAFALSLPALCIYSQILA